MPDPAAMAKVASAIARPAWACFNRREPPLDAGLKPERGTVLRMWSGREPPGTASAGRVACDSITLPPVCSGPGEDDSLVAAVPPPRHSFNPPDDRLLGVACKRRVGGEGLLRVGADQVHAVLRE